MIDHVRGIWCKKFQGHSSLQGGIEGLEDRSHAASTNLAEDLIVANETARQGGHTSALLLRAGRIKFQKEEEKPASSLAIRDPASRAPSPMNRRK
jgi:hypothetical protein